MCKRACAYTHVQVHVPTNAHCICTYACVYVHALTNERTYAQHTCTHAVIGCMLQLHAHT